MPGKVEKLYGSFSGQLQYGVRTETGTYMIFSDQDVFS
jgi:hypothetical protein